jgi:hypothetical protein
MADWDKDSGVALLFPALVARGARARRLEPVHGRRPAAAEAEQFDVDWAVPALRGEGSAQSILLSDCPYRNRSVVVCRIE